MDKKPSYEELEKKIEQLEQEALEYKRADNALYEKYYQFKILCEKSPLAYQSLDENGNIVTINPSWLDLLGYSKKEVIGKYFGNFLHPDWKVYFKNNFSRIKAIGEISGIECVMVKKNGSFLTVLIYGRINKDKQGNILQTHCIFQDITDHKRSEKKLLDSSRMHKILMTIASRCINIPMEKVNNAINEVLKDIGQFVDADRAYIFKYDFTKNITINTHEWCQKGVKPQIDNLQEYPLNTAQDWIESHNAGKPVLIPDITKLPSGEMKDTLEQQDIKSLVSVPMFNINKLEGFVGFDSVKKNIPTLKMKLILSDFLGIS